MNKKLRWTVIGLGGVTVIFVGWLIWLGWPQPASAPLPNPNGYDDFLRAASLSPGRVNADADQGTERLRGSIETNSEALRVLRQGLARPAAVPTDAVITNFSANMPAVMGMKQLALLLAAEGTLREREGQPGDAARSYVDAIRLGNEMSRGGLLINRLVGIACERVGEIPLVKLVPQLTPAQIHPLLPALEYLQTNRVTWTSVLADEHRFARAQVGRYPNPIHLAVALWRSGDLIKSAKAKHDLAVARLRLLTVELALRCYQGEHGKAPQGLEELAPRYVSELPLDPFSERALVYRPQGTNWVLYSVGPDRVDDGGKRVGRDVSGDDSVGLLAGVGGQKAAVKGDLFYDSPW